MSDEIKRAGLLLRTVSKILDFIIIAATIEVIPKAGFFAGLAYLLIGDGFFDGRSLGKKLIGLRVISADTNAACTFKDSILRNSTFGIGFIFYKIPWVGWLLIIIIAALEFVILLGSKNGMRIGDDLAKTTVIESPQGKKEI
jgi:uncharacterized RDD family membrane protein YckC